MTPSNTVPEPKSGSGDHPLPHFSKFDDNGDHYDPNGRHCPEPRKSRFRSDFSGEWPYEPVQLMRDLVEGRLTLETVELQQIGLDWFESEDYNVFFNRETGETIYTLCSKRGNVVHCARKSAQRKALSDAIESKVFDWPVPGTRGDHMTRLLFVTLTFDPNVITRERAWASLRSTEIEGCDAVTGVINNLEANMRSIFGPLCKLVCKEATSDGWPAPHLIFLLEEPVRVRYHKGKDGSVTWRIVDRRILRRIGKDPSMRSLYSRNHSAAISRNPIWKYGLFDVQGIIKHAGFGRYRNEVTYLFKYLTKCFSGDSSDLISDLDTISEAPEKLRTMLYTHLGNKCFRTRDISFGKMFKERVGLLPPETDSGNSPWRRLRTIPGFVHDDIVKAEQRRALRKLRELFPTRESETT